MKLTEDAYFDHLATEQIISRLQEEGYGTYARRLMAYKLHVADFILGKDGKPIRNVNGYVSIACMLPGENKIYINPAFFDERQLKEKMWPQLSLLVRHELLHFLLDHEERFKAHLQKKYPQTWQSLYNKGSIHELANYAMDWELSEKGYDKEDVYIAKHLHKNAEVIEGLVLESDHPEWLGQPMEDLFDHVYEEKLKAQEDARKNNPTIHVKKATHSQEYRDVYNAIMKKYDLDTITDGQLAQLLADAQSGKDLR